MENNLDHTFDECVLYFVFWTRFESSFKKQKLGGEHDGWVYWGYPRCLYHTPISHTNDCSRREGWRCSNLWRYRYIHWILKRTWGSLVAWFSPWKSPVKTQRMLWSTQTCLHLTKSHSFPWDTGTVVVVGTSFQEVENSIVRRVSVYYLHSSQLAL